MDKQSCVQFMQQTNDDQSNRSDDSADIDAVPKLHTMPDDCLLQIFSPKFLHIKDLCSLAETCKRFRTVTQSFLRGKSRYESLLNGFRLATERIWFLVNEPNGDVERVFRNFGSSLWAIDADSDENVLKLVERHCGDKLKEVKLRRVTIPALLDAIELKAVFHQLQKLQLQQATINGDTSLFAELNSLVELEVFSVSNCSVILECVFPKLERFTYAKDKIEIVSEFFDLTDKSVQSLERITTFITHHSGLKSLDILFSCDHTCRTIILDTIVESCTELEEMTMDIEMEREHPIQNGNKRGRHAYTWAAAEVLKQPLKAIKSLRSVMLTENRVHSL